MSLFIYQLGQDETFLTEENEEPKLNQLIYFLWRCILTPKCIYYNKQMSMNITTKLAKTFSIVRKINI